VGFLSFGSVDSARMTSQALSEIVGELGGIVLELFLIILLFSVKMYNCRGENTIETTYLSRALTKSSLPQILPGRTKGPKRQMAGDTRGPALKSTDPCQPIKAVRWLVHLEHEGTSG